MRLPPPGGGRFVFVMLLAFTPGGVLVKDPERFFAQGGMHNARHPQHFCKAIEARCA
jgi:hypothetical protein